MIPKRKPEETGKDIRNTAIPVEQEKYENDDNTDANDKQDAVQHECVTLLVQY